LELPLSFSSNVSHQKQAHRAATEFAIVYQIADDLADFAQDAEERSPYLLLRFIERDHLSVSEAHLAAMELATARLASMQEIAESLPNRCAQLMVTQAEMLRSAIAESMQAV
jgi:geranylgeranyl diphosphate synthase type II